MKPYWTSADGTLSIYHGDARDALPELDLTAVNLVLADPPYGIDGGRATSTGNAARAIICGLGGKIPLSTFAMSALAW